MLKLIEDLLFCACTFQQRFLICRPCDHVTIAFHCLKGRHSEVADSMGEIKVFYYSSMIEVTKKLIKNWIPQMTTSLWSDSKLCNVLKEWGFDWGANTDFLRKRIDLKREYLWKERQAICGQIRNQEIPQKSWIRGKAGGGECGQSVHWPMSSQKRDTNKKRQIHT